MTFSYQRTSRIKTKMSYKVSMVDQWGSFYLFIADFFATQIIGGDKELVVLL
jgi:hypothetical protein